MGKVLSSKFLKGILLTLISLFLLSENLSAHGAKDVEEMNVSNLESWQESFELAGKKKGKYNIMVTATDLGGNVHIEGPHNLYIDPDSDLPISGITNPHQDMRIVGNLNIVGTCVDDDAVQYVELILDGDEDHPVRATGKEFWSYYLDTTKLEEGPHTIKVVGTDINGLVGNPVELSWNLDRRQPVTDVNNREMGVLVSGSVKFSGVVSDGNGIKSLEYSVDSGETFKEIKLKDKKTFKEFEISVDTKKFPDGPSVIWFKAIDNAGSAGIYSFLYFIDNTKPEISIITPQEKDPQYGRVAISGVAKDKIGITELKWTFGTESGEFDLVPGNPYWGITFDTMESKDTSRKFTITGKDLVGNVTTVSRTISLDQALDKPTLTFSEPSADTVLDADDAIYVRGIAKDKEGISSVFYKLDDGEFVEEKTKGTFYGILGIGSDLTPGKHTITAYAVDKNGVRGDSVSTSFNALGPLPVFSEAKLSGGTGAGPVVDGMSVHPEAGLSFQTTVSCGMGLESVHYELIWGSVGNSVQDITCNGATSQLVNIPMSPDMPKGIVKVFIEATDTKGRKTDYRALLDVVNTSYVTTSEPKVVFDDSTVSEDGVIINNAEFPATGYFIGGNARSVEIIPATNFASAELNGNQIVLLPGKGVGTSEPVTVRVTTDQGLRYDSQKLIFRNDTAIPVLTVKEFSETKTIDGTPGIVTITGSATCSTGLKKVYYNLLSSRATMAGNVINAMEAVNKEEPVDLELKRGAFSFEFNAGERGYGLYFIEVVAESNAGNKSSSVVCIRNVPELGMQPNGKPYVAKGPMIVWADSEDVYAACITQDPLMPPVVESPAPAEGEGESAEGEAAESAESEAAEEKPAEIQDFKIFKRSEMTGGSNSLSWQVTNMKGKTFSSKYSATKVPDIKAYFVNVNEKRYLSGVPVEISNGSSATLYAYVDVEGTLTGADYEITGEAVPGGSEKQNGSATFAPVEGVENRYEVKIPLNGLPVRVNKVKLTVKVGSFTKELIGSVSVVRPADKANTDDNRSIYLMQSAGTVYDRENKLYMMKAGSSFNFYCNTPEIVSADLLNPIDGITLERNGNNVILTISKDGTFKWQQIRVKDINGISYTSPEAHFLVDSAAPELVISTPALHAWVKKSLRITGTASDPSGVKNGEYSIDGGLTWKALNISSATKGSLGVTFSNTEDISGMEDGEIRLDVRVWDMAGHVAYARTVAQKDVTPPTVEIVMPTDEAVVNGDNLIGFKIYDEGSFEKAYYIAPPGLKNVQPKQELVPDTFLMTHIGTEVMPIDDAMSFQFVDDAGNVQNVESWKFMIDNKSDLPIAEVHLPAENEVITRDFTISGVVYDDDGASTIYYKIDKGEYIELPEPSTSFAIDVPFSTMVDNEHTISVYAVDINGVKGPVMERKFRVSTEEPKGAVVTPSIDTSVRGVVTLSGYASDKNSIDRVYVSLDNGNSYNLAVGQEDWKYTFDTRAIPNGTQVVFIKIFDKYEIQGLYSSLINIDNQAPEMILDYPEDYSITSGPLFFSGYAFDNVNITEMYVTIRSLDGKTIPRNMQKINFQLERIIANTLDFAALDSGFYNVELTALDKAGNATHVSRNIQVDKNKPLAVVNLLYPLNGEHKQGNFNIYGEATADKPIESLALYIDDKFIADTLLEKTGFFKFGINSSVIESGVHKYRVDARVKGGTVIRSREQTVDYSAFGPWITVDSFTYGDFAIGRPYITGHADYALDEEELLLSRMKSATPEQKAAILKKKVARVEISFDNGKTFEQISKNEKWAYRVENEDLPEGYHFMLVRATMKNGDVAIDRCIIQIDNSAPSIRLIAPSPSGRYNQELMFSGLSGDDVGLSSVKLALRKGDKASYEVPSFIQGLYFDWSFWGATLFSLGAGLTFFDDNVKLQIQWGQFTQTQRNLFDMSEMRYGGDNVIGVKLIANIAQIPFSYFLGRDFDWLSASVAVGANFTRFNQSNSGQAQILSAVLAQLEFPKVNFKQMKMFSTFSLYSEFSFWFIPTDVQSAGDVSIKNLVPQFSEGIRVNVF